jgi:hypothetical protein
MKTYTIRADVRVDEAVTDRDAWAVDLIEAGTLSDQLKAGWFWATWPDRVELVFTVRADDRSIQHYTKEIELLLAHASHVVSQSKLLVEQRGDEA